MSSSFSHDSVDAFLLLFCLPRVIVSYRFATGIDDDSLTVLDDTHLAQIGQMQIPRINDLEDNQLKSPADIEDFLLPFGRHEIRNDEGELQIGTESFDIVQAGDEITFHDLCLGVVETLEQQSLVQTWLQYLDSTLLGWQNQT